MGCAQDPAAGADLDLVANRDCGAVEDDRALLDEAAGADGS
jgi:hypothetical protein